MADRLKGKVAIVTGAAPQTEGVGNGMATAILFAREGAKVVLVNRNSERAEHLASQIKDEGGEASAFAGDVCDPRFTEALADFTVKTYGKVDILHNNVGHAGSGNAETIELDVWNDTIATHLTSTMLCTRSCIPIMKENGGGSVITISSIAGAVGLVFPGGGSIAYSTAKGGIHGYTLALAANFGEYNIRANCIVIGPVYTPMSAGFGEEGRARRAKAVALQQEGTAWDIAYGAVYLASDEARWVTGVILPIDGGFVNIRQGAI
jgi:NAD(P)-dependent dehydrogenase (short-subunit alcohol dehydrogenase family)